MFKCKSCGGETEKNGHVYICVYCESRWEEEPENDINAVERANAWAALRDGDFEKAEAEFENIIGKDKTNYEAWWGKALADNHITYVNDLSENKKVPTCNNITNDSFVESTAVKNAIANAPSEIAFGYKQMAEQIDKIRVEWLNVASKEPAYDVFLSFKDSDKERGLTRTQDSYDAQDLYNALIAEGYKVFFSRISLRDKISEQYEPYIYNAIRTAKVMIVFGEKAEYFSSTWIKNEWTRFRTRIEKKEKHKNSLVVVYKDMDPGELPASLRARQCMNMSDMTFLSDLNRHIARIIEAEKQKAGLDRIEIASGVIAKKATSLQVNEVKTKELNAAATETDITALQTLELVDSYLAGGAWDSASSLIDQVLFDEPGSPEAAWRLLLCEMQAKNEKELVNNINNWKDVQYERLIKVLDTATAKYAGEKLKLMYSAIEFASDEVMEYVLNKIYVYNFSGRAQSIKKCFTVAIKQGMYKTFCKLLTLLASDEVDTYIDYNMQYAKRKDEYSLECIERVLAVDEGYADALWLKLQPLTDKDELIKAFEEILKFSKDTDADVIRFLDEAEGEKLKIVTRVIRYYKKDVKELYNHLQVLGGKLLACGLFEDAEECYKLALSIDKNYADGYWGVCLAKLHAKNDDEVKEGKVLLGKIPEYSKYLVLVPEERRQECIALEAKQKKIYTVLEQATTIINSIKGDSVLNELEKEKVECEQNIKISEQSIDFYEKAISEFPTLYSEYESLKNEAEDNKRQIENLNNERKGLGIFSGKRKKEIDSNVALLTSKKNDIEKKIKKFDDNYLGMNRILIESKKYEMLDRKQKDLSKLQEIKEKIDREQRSGSQIIDKKEVLEYIKIPAYADRIMSISGVDIVFPIVKLMRRNIGSKVTFGRYNYTVLSKEGCKLLLISSECIGKREYHKNYDGITWEKCTIRKWLNSGFINSAFSQDERDLIVSTNVKNYSNEKFRTASGNNKVDKIFLLSLEEAEKYFSSDSARIGKYNGEAEYWWLRSPGLSSMNAAIVWKDGSLFGNGSNVNDALGVRPAFWVDISNL